MKECSLGRKFSHFLIKISFFRKPFFQHTAEYFYRSIKIEWGKWKMVVFLQIATKFKQNFCIAKFWNNSKKHFFFSSFWFSRVNWNKILYMDFFFDFLKPANPNRKHMSVVSRNSRDEISTFETNCNNSLPDNILKKEDVKGVTNNCVLEKLKFTAK